MTDAPAVRDDQSGSPQPERPDVFISYSRQDNDFVLRLKVALEARGKDVWIDSDDIQKGADWWERIEAGIEAARAVVPAISPGFAASSVCEREVSHAIQHNKRLLPVLRSSPEGARLVREIEAVNWVFFDDDDRFDQAVAELVQALETDLLWLDRHARLLVRALEWRRAKEGSRSSLLLRGADLRQAEEWLSGQAHHAEQATSDQIDFIFASRRAASRRQRITIGAVASALIVSVGLTIFALMQRNEAVNQAEIAQSQLLAAQARATLPVDRRGALELAVRAMHTHATSEARLALRQTAPFVPVLKIQVGSTAESGSGVEFSADGKLLVAFGGKTASVWDPRSRRRLATLVGHAGGVEDAIFSAGGSLAATNDDRDFRVWNARTGKSVAVLQVRPGLPVYERQMAFSPTGQFFATHGERASNEGDEWIVWNARTWKPVKTLPSSGLVAFSRDGRYLVIPDELRHSFDVRETTHWKSVATLGSPVSEPIFVDFAFSADGKLAAATWDRLDATTVTVYSTRNWSVVRELRLPAHQSRSQFTFSADGRRLAFFDRGGDTSNWSVSIWDTRSWKNLVTRDVGSLSPDWTLGISQHEQTGTFDLVDMTSGQPVATFYGADNIDNVAISRGRERLVATAAFDGRVLVWQLPAPRVWSSKPCGLRPAVFGLTLAPGHRYAVVGAWSEDRTSWCMEIVRPGGEVKRFDTSDSGASFSPDGRFLAVDSGGICLEDCRDTGMNLYSTQNWRKVTLARGGSHGAWSRDGRYLAVWLEPTGDDATDFYPRVSIYRVGTWQLKRVKGSLKEPIVGASFSADGRLVASIQGRAAVIWRVADGSVVATLSEPRERIQSVRFAPAGDLVVTVGGRGHAHVWHGRDGSSVALLPRPASASGIAFSGRAELLAAVTRDESRTHLYVTTDWEEPSTFRGSFLSVSSDNRLLLTRTLDGVVHAWEVETGEAVMELAARDAAAFSVPVFGTDNRSIISVGRDAILRTFPCPACAAIGTMLARAERYLRESS